MKTLIHLEIGHENWEPTHEELLRIQQMFVKAMEDPKGAVVATPVGVTVSTYHLEEADEVEEVEDSIEYIDEDEDEEDLGS